jgi:hypothetical protein
VDDEKRGQPRENWIKQVVGEIKALESSKGNKSGSQERRRRRRKRKRREKKRKKERSPVTFFQRSPVRTG